MKVAVLAVTALLLFTLWPQTATTQTTQKPVDLAQKAGEAWLALTDSGKYGESWDEASTPFKAALSKEKWNGMLQANRAPLGVLKSRKLNSATYAKNPPNAPEGQYVILTYTASFIQMTSATETVSMFLDKDGKWRVSGYFIK